MNPKFTLIFLLVVFTTTFEIQKTFTQNFKPTISSQIWKNGILQEEQCILNPVQCPYSGGYSLPQCFTHPISGNQWAVCVSENNEIGGGSFTFNIDFKTTIKDCEPVHILNCDLPRCVGSSFSMHCHCAGHCNINTHWVVTL